MIMDTKTKNNDSDVKQPADSALSAAPGYADELAKRIAADILTVSASGEPVLCSRAVMMTGKYPDGERDMGGRNAASIAFVIKEHLMDSGLFSHTDEDSHE